MNAIDTNAGGWRLQAVAGAISHAAQIERDRIIAQNYVELEAARRGAHNDPDDMTWDF